MQLLPMVKNLAYNDEVFCLKRTTMIVIPDTAKELYPIAQKLKKEIAKATSCQFPVITSSSDLHEGIVLQYSQILSGEQYTIQITTDRILLEGGDSRALFWAIQTLLQMLRLKGFVLPGCSIYDEPDYTQRGFYHDITRGKVPKLETLKSLVDTMVKYKLNQLQLYVEHTFAFRQVPELWAGTDPITAEEILELDSYCRENFVDLVPSLSTFGHLYELLRVKRFERLNELPIAASTKPYDLWDRMAHYTIDVSREESFSLIKKMIEEYIPLFSSRYFNICCDETFDLGKGKNKSAAEKRGVGRLYVEYVNKLIDVVVKKGKIPMLWGDIVLKHPELLKEINPEAIYLNWAYDADVTEEGTALFAASGVRQIVCPGVQGWSRFANDINAASENIRRMVLYGKKYGAIGALNTDWGDCGHVNFFASSFHGMIYGAALSWNAEVYQDDSQFDRAVAMMQWADSSGALAGLLREMGSLCFYHFGNMYAWAENLKGKWNVEQKVRDVTYGELFDHYNEATKICLGIKNICFTIKNEKNSIDFDEFVWSARAVQWTLALLVAKKIGEYKQKSKSILLSKGQLIEEGYTLLYEFKRLWRIRNKESELYRIVQIWRTILEKIECLELM